MSKTISRIIELIQQLGMSARQFDISIAASNGYTLRMQKNNASVGSDVIERIIEKYPQINLIWLITGKGDMFMDTHVAKPSKSKSEIEAYINKRLNEKWSSEKKALLEEILKEIDDEINSKTKNSSCLSMIGCKTTILSSYFTFLLPVTML
jgi:hypothetical protein